MKELLEKIESCGYECKAGRLELNRDWIELRERVAKLEILVHLFEITEGNPETIKSRWDERLKEMRDRQKNRMP